MRILVAVFSILATVLITPPVWAQDYSGEQELQYDRPMMQPGMMYRRGMMGRGMMEDHGMMGHGMMREYGMRGHGMMGCSKHGFMRAIYHLPDLKTRLDLTDDQVSELNKHQTDFMKRKADWKAEIDKKRIDLENQLDKKASVSDIRNTLEAISKVLVDMRVAGYETSQKMISTLTPEQKKQWDDLCCFRQQGRGMKSQ